MPLKSAVPDSMKFLAARYLKEGCSKNSLLIRKQSNLTRRATVCDFTVLCKLTKMRINTFPQHTKALLPCLQFTSLAAQHCLTEFKKRLSLYVSCAEI